MKKIISVVILLFSFSLNGVSAQRIDNDYVKEVIEAMDFEVKPESVKEKDGLLFKYTSVEGGSYYTNEKKEDLSECHWYRSGANFIFGTSGAELEITNTTDSFKSIIWSESNMELGTYSGIPSISGMKIEDYGKPSATPNTLIPPHKSVKVSVFIGESYYVPIVWFRGFAYIRANHTPLFITLTMKISESDGTFHYDTLTSPNIIIPNSIIDKYAKK